VPEKEKKCIPCLEEFDDFMWHARFARIFIEERKGRDAIIHIDATQYHLFRMEGIECYPKEMTDMLKEDLERTRKAVGEKAWGEAKNRIGKLESLMHISGIKYIIGHCRKELEKAYGKYV